MYWVRVSNELALVNPISACEIVKYRAKISNQKMFKRRKGEYYVNRPKGKQTIF